MYDILVGMILRINPCDLTLIMMEVRLNIIPILNNLQFTHKGSTLMRRHNPLQEGHQSQLLLLPKSILAKVCPYSMPEDLQNTFSSNPIGISKLPFANYRFILILLMVGFSHISHMDLVIILISIPLSQMTTMEMTLLISIGRVVLPLSS